MIERPIEDDLGEQARMRHGGQGDGVVIEELSLGGIAHGSPWSEGCGHPSTLFYGVKAVGTLRVPFWLAAGVFR